MATPKGLRGGFPTLLHQASRSARTHRGDSWTNRRHAELIVMADDRTLRILVVDDDTIDREIVRRALTTHATASVIAEAASVAEAEQALSAAHVDCVILDYQLPEGPCREFFPRLKALANGAPFIVLTGHGDE